MITTKSFENETLDAVVYRIFGKGSPVVEQVMELNPNLAGVLILPTGTTVKLPNLSDLAQPETSSINLWD